MSKSLYDKFMPKIIIGYSFFQFRDENGHYMRHKGLAIINDRDTYKYTALHYYNLVLKHNYIEYLQRETSQTNRLFFDYKLVLQY